MVKREIKKTILIESCDWCKKDEVTVAYIVCDAARDLCEACYLYISNRLEADIIEDDPYAFKDEVIAVTPPETPWADPVPLAQPIKKKKKRGRPKGSTNKKKVTKKVVRKPAVAKATAAEGAVEEKEPTSLREIREQASRVDPAALKESQRAVNMKYVDGEPPSSELEWDENLKCFRQRSDIHQQGVKRKMQQRTDRKNKEIEGSLTSDQWNAKPEG